MLQRVQSVLLLAASVLMLLVFIWPLASFYSTQSGIMEMYAYKLKIIAATQGEISVSPVLTGFISLLAVATAGVCIYSISLYKNRIRQVKVTRMALVVNIVFIVVVFALTDYIRKAVNITPEYGTAAFFPVVALMFQLLAMRFIKKDEELVKSADRLR